MMMQSRQRSPPPTPAQTTTTALINPAPAAASSRTTYTYTRHPDLWFTDGSIVLKADSVIFRVHMSILSRHSVFFRDMFSLPQPPQPSSSSCTQDEVLEGCPLITLQDSPDDLASLLVALYDGTIFGDNGREDFKVVAGILRLSSKYMVDSLRAKALAHLTEAWPPTLKGWDAREDRARSHEQETGAGRGLLYPSPIEVINLAREINAPGLLPSAFYDLSRYHYTQIFEPLEDDPLYPRDPCRGQLSPSDMQKLALGKESSARFITSLIQSMSAPSPNAHMVMAAATPHHRRTQSHTKSSGSTSSVCMSISACRKDFSELVELATQHYLFDREKGCSDPLYVAEELGQLKSAEFESECLACAKSLEAWAGRERERMWRLIPGWFRLDQ
ncbi:hypothetical protein BXZ70DRAFT_632781 [Cristinia sonorae]|uniref:BTB domain-containing protein n=1 Tax=Cristinia sonorae TaxID=1940300 RepID=A0A8K0XKA5_9AGAR|nr:hypothetical protein BXZ70DRAFT_632781 [Cristinia sonorae]